jgi:D-glycero-D-manno-heptose 1,7-bisphosphate phosphatase
MGGGEPMKLIILDRDGVLNEMVVDSEHGTIDSPLHLSQVKIIPGVPGALRKLTDAGYLLAIASNQPSAAKGKTTRDNLDAVHSEVLRLAQSEGGKIESSHLCFHRSEDLCACRKPLPGLLLEAMQRTGALPSQTWMVGDGVTDVRAGQAAHVRTAFLGPNKCDICKIFEQNSLAPDLRCPSLVAFAEEISLLF